MATKKYKIYGLTLQNTWEQIWQTPKKKDAFDKFSKITKAHNTRARFQATRLDEFSTPENNRVIDFRKY